MIHRRYSLGLRLSYLLALLAHDASESEPSCVVLSDIIRNDILLSAVADTVGCAQKRKKIAQ
jgi:hypothetical protein